MIKIGIVDDNPALLRNVANNMAIFDEIEISFKVLNGQDAFDAIKEIQPDVILMEIEMPKMDGIETTRWINNIYPHIKIIMLTVVDREDKIFDAIKAGASGYMLKDEKPTKIMQAIEDTMEGRSPMSPVVARKALELLRNQGFEAKEEKLLQPSSFDLSTREIEILEKIAEGKNYNQIAEVLFISPKTARKHIENIYQKLHVHSKLEAVKMAQKNKWVK
jgi:DNA-binding NarL/FixJ family response regulator